MRYTSSLCESPAKQASPVVLPLMTNADKVSPFAFRLFQNVLIIFS